VTYKLHLATLIFIFRLCAIEKISWWIFIFPISFFWLIFYTISIRNDYALLDFYFNFITPWLYVHKSILSLDFKGNHSFLFDLLRIRCLNKMINICFYENFGGYWNLSHFHVMLCYEIRMNYFYFFVILHRFCSHFVCMIDLYLHTINRWKLLILALIIFLNVNKICFLMYFCQMDNFTSYFNHFKYHNKLILIDTYFDSFYLIDFKYNSILYIKQNSLFIRECLLI
jgi:hypothetical protein